MRRRSFLLGLGALVAAPAVIRVAPLMRVKAFLPPGSPYTLITQALAGSLHPGDIITFPDCFALDRYTKRPTPELRQFVVTATASVGSRHVSIYPGAIERGRPFATVSRIPRFARPEIVRA